MGVPSFRQIFLATFVGVFAQPVIAYDSMDISGFATVGMFRSDNESVYRGFIDRDVDYNFQTRAGVSFSKELSDTTSGRIQFIARGADEDFETRVNIAQIEWTASSNIVVRVGKIRLPLYLYSDFQDVGDAYVWNQLPVEMYGVTPVDSLIGATMIYSRSWGKWGMDLEFLAGGGESQFVAAGNLRTTDTNDLWGANFKMGTNDFDLRFAYYTAGKVTTELLIEVDTGTTGTFSRTLTVNKSTIDNVGTFTMGLRYHPKRFLVVYERAIIDSNEATIDKYDAYYATLGVKFNGGRNIIYTTFSEVADAVGTSLSEQRTISLGYTHRVHSSLSAKVELYRINTAFDNKAKGQFSSAPNRDVNTAGVSLNYAL